MKNKLFNIWKQNKASINAWLSIPNSFTAEAFGKMGWDSVTIDMRFRFRRSPPVPKVHPS